MWNGLGSWRDSDIDRFVDFIVPQVRAGAITTAQLTDAYLSTITGETLNTGLVAPADLRNGVALEEVYRRPATTLYTELAEGKNFSTALEIATERLKDLVQTDMQLAMTRQAQRSLQGSNVKMYRRTVGGNKTCALCMIASTQRYWKKDLLPIHPGCGCGVEPYIGPDEQVIEPELLDEIHLLVTDRFGFTDYGARDIGLNATDSQGNRISDYKKLILVREHGEYGPTLTWTKDNFTGPGDIR